MTQDDLLKMLDLAGTKPDPAGPMSIMPAVAKPADEGGLTAFRLDEWGLRRGRDLVAESERLRRLATDCLGSA